MQDDREQANKENSGSKQGAVNVIDVRGAGNKGIAWMPGVR